MRSSTYCVNSGTASAIEIERPSAAAAANAAPTWSAHA
jgi:hypothetical protein